MTRGFHVAEQIDARPEEVWSALTDFTNARRWMNGVEEMVQETSGALGLGTRFRFRSRGHVHHTVVTEFVPGQKIALTSTQGGITATYIYSVLPSDRGSTITLNATCTAKGYWKLVHPLIAYAMKRADSRQLANLTAEIRQKA